MKLLLAVIVISLSLSACTNLPLNKVPYGVEIHGFIVYDWSQNIEYYSVAQSGGIEVDLKKYPVVTRSLNEDWKLSVSDDFINVFQAEGLQAWLRQYGPAMDLVAPHIRASSYDITLVPNGLTYRVKTRQPFTESLLPLTFVISVPDDTSPKEAFKKVFRTFSHEQYHIYQRLDIRTKPADAISEEAFAYFASNCVLNTIFMEIPDPRTKGIREINLADFDRAKLREAMEANAETKDIVQHSLAGKVIMLYLFDKMMDKPNKNPAEFSAELNGFCSVFGANTPATWDELLDLYDDYQRTPENLSTLAVQARIDTGG